MSKKTLSRRFILICIVFFTINSYAASPVSLTLSAGISNDNNITRAELDSDILKDSILSASGSADYNIKLSAISSVTLSGLLKLNQYQDFDKLSHTRIGLGASYQIQPNTHYTAPWYSTSFEYQDWNFDSDMRSGSLLKLTLDYGKRLTDKMELRTGLSFQSRDAESVIFDTDSSRLYINFDFKLSNRNTLYTALFYNDGDIISTVKSTSPTTTKLASIPWEIDDAFSSTWWSYKLDATTLGLNIGDNYAISTMQSIDLSILYYSSSAYGGSDYTGLIADLNYYYRF